MKFNQLPQELIASVMDRCDFPTVVNLSKTTSKMNKIAKGYHLDKIDVEDIDLTDNAGLDVSIGCSKFTADAYGGRYFDGMVLFADSTVPEKFYYRAYDKTRGILNSVKSLKSICFADFTIDDTFMKMLKEFPLDWSNIAADFFDCYFEIPREDLLKLWKMFKSSYNTDPLFTKENAVELINDEMMLITLPTITFNTNEYNEEVTFEHNPGLTDRTLELLAEHRPPKLHMVGFISNFTTEGLKNLFKTIITSEDSTIYHWCLGAIELDLEAFAHFFDDFAEFDTDSSEVKINKDWPENGYLVTIEYSKENVEKKGKLAIVLIKPPELLQDEEEQRWIAEHREEIDEWMREQSDDEDTDMEDEEFDDENNNFMWF